MLLLHIAGYLIEEKEFLHIQDVQARAGSGAEPEVCNCGNKPDVCYLEPIDSFYVKCEKCGIQTEFVDTIDEAVKKWAAWKGKGEEKPNV